MIYFDHNATSPMDPRVLAAMLPYYQLPTGNPLSLHRQGRHARTALEQARAQVAELVNAQPEQVIFTGSATEANNLALKGYTQQHAPTHLCLSAVEHKSLLNPAEKLTAQGSQLDLIAPDQHGEITLAQLQKYCQPQTQWLSILFANNETGVIQDIPKMAAFAKTHNIFFHCDAVQAAGKIRIDFEKMGVDSLTLSAHKFGGPQGVGALICKNPAALQAIIEGGGQENNLRSGSYNLAGIVGFGKIAQLANQELTQRHCAMLMCQHHLEEQLALMPMITILGTQAKRLPNTTLFAVQGIEGETLIMELDRLGFAVSGGAACGLNQPSHVVAAMQVEPNLINNVIRISFNADNTQAEVDAFCLALQTLCKAMAID